MQWSPDDHYRDCKLLYTVCATEIGIRRDTYLHLTGRDPGWRFVSPLYPERMAGTWSQRVVLTLDANLKKRIFMLRRQRGDRLGLQLARRPVARNHLVAHLDLLDRNITVVGMNRR